MYIVILILPHFDKLTIGRSWVEGGACESITTIHQQPTQVIHLFPLQVTGWSTNAW